MKKSEVLFAIDNFKKAFFEIFDRTKNLYIKSFEKFLKKSR